MLIYPFSVISIRFQLYLRQPVMHTVIAITKSNSPLPSLVESLLVTS